jgi:pimeloyl-ACP methyl ester carboxylesterase
MEALIGELGLERFILFGTSLGGIVTMLLSMTHKERIAAALINDIGPVIDPAGIDRIKSYVGKSQSWPTWLHAARHFSELLHETYPKWSLDRWLVLAKRVCKLSSAGRVVLDYDMRIAEPFRVSHGDTGFDMWSAYRGLAEVPLLVVRGEQSDLLAEDTLAQMQSEMPLMESVTVPDVGHAPTLDEPEVQAAIDSLLSRAV